MTLKEAHEIQRKELISLRAENKRLKAGSFTSEEKLSLEKEIRMLKKTIRELNKNIDCYKHWLELEKKKSERLANIVYGEFETLKIEHAILLQKYEELTTTNQSLQDSNDKLKSQLNRDHENSSIPSSKERFPKKIKNSRVKSGQKQGAQKGHIARKRPHMTATKTVVTIPVPPDILANPDYYLTGKMITKQVCDIEINVSVTEYTTPEYRSRSTGKRGHAPFPGGIRNEFNYGPNSKALAFLLNNYCNVSIDKTSEIISAISNGTIALSRGLINDLPRQFSQNTIEDRSRIFNRLLQAPVMYSDATPGRVNGKTVQVIVCANEDELLYSFREHKGHQGIKGTPVEEYQQILVHDHDITYYNYGSDHQECLAHVLRYLQDSIENEPELTWNVKMKEFLSSLIHSFKSEPHLYNEEFIKEKENEYSKILFLASTEYSKHPPKKYYPEGFNLYKRMEKYKYNHLLFLRHPEVNYTNNLSERSLRKFKRKQLQAVTFRSNKSVEYLCDCMSIIETYRLYNANIYDIVRNAFS